ncbi:MAG: YceI family protein, partial [Bacteroidota bacterium]
QMDAAASEMTWTGYGEIGNFVQTGAVTFTSGQVICDGDSISGGNMVIDMTSIDHENGQLRKHLRAKDFFHTKKYPKATFVLASSSTDRLYGRLTIKGETHPVVIPISVQADHEQLVITGTATIDRTKYGIKYNSSRFFQNLGNYAIKDNFDLEFRIVANLINRHSSDK